MKGQDNRKYAIYSRKSKFTGKGAKALKTKLSFVVNISSSTMTM